MKKLNLIEWLSRNSHEKQKPQRFARYAAILIMLLTLGVGQMWAATQKYIYVGISNDYQSYKDGSKFGLHVWGGSDGDKIMTLTWVQDSYEWDSRNYTIYRAYVYDNATNAQFKAKEDWWSGSLSVSWSGTTNNAVFFSASADGWQGEFVQNYQYTSSTSLTASNTTVATGTSVTLTPALTSNTTYNVIKSTTYAVTTNPGSGGTVTSGGVFSASKAGTYTVTATITYNAKGFTGITKTATPTATITVYSPYTISSGSTVVWDLCANEKSWSSVYLFKDVEGTGSNESFTQCGSTTQYRKTYASDVTKIKSFLFRNNTSNWNDYTQTTDITSSVSGVTLFEFDGTYTGTKLNWQKTTGAKKATSGTKVYFDNTDANWEEIWIKYGTTRFNRHTGARATKVTGTDNLYVITMPEAYYVGWYFADNYGWTGRNTYQVQSGDGISNRINYQTTNLTEDITFVPSSGAGTPKVWTTTDFSGHTRRLTFGSHTNGQITVRYTDESGVEHTVSSESASYVDVAQTCKVVITAVPNSGYAPSTLSLGGVGITSGAQQIIRAAGTITATFVEEETHDVTISYMYGTRSLHDAQTFEVGVTTASDISAEVIDGFSFSNWSNLTNVTNNSANLTTNPININTIVSGSDGSMTCNYTPWTCSLDLVASEGATGYSSRTAMSYDATAKAYYLNRTTASSTERYRFYINSIEYSTNGNVELVIAGTKVDANKDVTGYASNKPSVYFNDGPSGSNITIWFDYENKKAWVTEQKHTVTISAGANGSVSPTSVSVGNVVKSGSITATPSSHYHLSSWTIPSGVTLVDGSTTTSPITIKATADSRTVTANFAGDVYTITYKDQGGGAFSGSQTTPPASHTYGTATTLKIPTKSGYTFGGWFTSIDCTTGAIGNTSSASLGATAFTANITLYAKWTENMTTVNLVASPTGKGTFTIGGAAATSTTAGVTTTRSVTAVPATGYYLTGTIWSKNNENITLSSTTTSPTTVTGCGTAETSSTLTATFTPNTYTVHFHRNGGAGDVVDQDFTYDAAQNLTANTYTRTGYTFAGWALTTDGAVTYANNANVSNLTSENGATFHLYAKWTPNPYAITFDATTNGGALVGSSPKNVIFDETSVADCPTATKDGYCFDGWYTKASSGQKVINADGTLVASVTDVSQYTGTGGAWKKASATTVYAVYVAPTIEMTPDPTALNSRKTEKDTVVIHQTFSCVPTGNYNVVYTVGYSANHTQLPSQPTIKYGTGLGTGYDTIKMPMDANTYEIVAELRTGSTRGAGTIVKRDTIDYVVEAQYAVTLHYVVDGKNIRESRQVYAYPTSAPSEVRVFMEESGYELDYWEMGVGIDSVSGRWSIIDGGVAGNLMSKYIYAANNGNIYLHYKPKTNTVYFFNTFSMYWYQTIMKKYDYGTSTNYWNNNNESGTGAGSKLKDGSGKITPDTVKSTTTSLEEKRWMASIGASTTNFAFVSEKKDQQHFWGLVAGNEYPKVIYRTDYNAATPMFVPVSTDVTSDYYILNRASDGEAHYYRGFWVKYSPNSDSTGYYLHVYNQKAASGAKLIQSLPLRLTQTGEGNTWELTASMDLEGGKTYGFKITKATGVSTKAWYSYNGTLTAADHTGKVLDGTSDNIGLTTTSAGDYTFHVFCKDFGTIAANNATANQVQGQLAVTVDYATVSGDYRVIYSDATQTEVIASPSIHPRENGQDTVSFFIRKNAESRVMKIQRYTTNWADLKTVDLSSIAKDSVYVLYLQQNEGADDIEVAGYDFYDGDYYIRTDCVDEHKWDYKQSLDNHRMSPSDYGMADIQPDKFTHYYVHWIGKGGNVKFIVANKYAPCLSDTVITDTYANVAGGNLPSGYGANVRFMYNKGTNEALRAYLHGSEEGDDDYLKITTTTSQMGTTATTPVVIMTKTFTDEKNWVYQAEIKAKPGLTAKLTAEYDGKTQYFIGSADKEESIIGGTGDAWQQILLTYDFKVNRLICAWQPSGDSINGDVPINADIMIIRVGQADAQQIIFKNNDSKLSAVKYIYSVMQFNRDDMVGMMPRWDYWSYQHCMYYISFPYDVLVNDIMAPGRMGTEWRIQRYNGAKRAKGWFAGDGVTTFWEDVQAGDTLKAYEGYSLLLNRRIFNDGSSSVWQNKGAGTKLYMYFPSKDATTGVVANKTVNVTVPSHECTLDRIFDQDLGKPTSEQRNHKIVDSHWNMIGTPLFEDKVASTITDGPEVSTATETKTLQYIYEWNPAGNTLGIRNTLTTGFEFKTMYSYMAQYAGTITFVGSAVNKIVAANQSANKKNYTINLELTKDDTFVGRTYVELRENAVDTFLLNEDVYMVKNGVSADVYTLAGAYEAGANVLSIDNHIVPVGVDVKAAGTYTFSMPSNFDGEIILVDNYMQTRTNLMMEDYEIALPKANISDRFYLEININNTPTAIDGVSGDGSFKDGKAHKFIMNDMMYILKDGVLYDARGARVK